MDEMDNLRNVRPEPEQRSLFTARNRLTEEVRGGGRRGLSARIPFPHRGVTRVATAGALSVALAGGLVLSQTVSFGGGVPDSSARADEVLRRAAAAAEDRQPLGEGDFAYLKTKQRGPAGGHPMTTYEEVWTSVDASQPGLFRQKRVGGGVPERLEEKGVSYEEWKQRQRKQQNSWERHKFPAGERTGRNLVSPSFAYLRSLPQDPHKLAAKLKQQADELPENSTAGPFKVIAMALTDQVVPPGTAAAMFEAAQTFEGVSVVEDVELAASGEQGIAVTKVAGNQRTALVFDPETYQFMGVQHVAMEDSLFGDAKAGDVLGSTAVVERALVAEAGQLPGGGHIPAGHHNSRE